MFQFLLKYLSKKKPKKQKFNKLLYKAFYSLVMIET